MVSFQTSKRFFCTVSALSLLLLLPTASGRTETTPTGIRVEMDPQKLTLRVALWSGNDARVAVYKNRLPWGSAYSMILVAVTSSGQYLKNELPVDDPSPEQVSLDPKELIKGEIDLRKVFRGLDGVLKKSDVHLFWAYAAPEELHIAQAGGWIFIPQVH